MDVFAVNMPLLLLTASLAIAIGVLMSAANQPSPIRDAQRIWSLGLIAGPLGLALLRFGELLGVGLVEVAAKTAMTASFVSCLLALAMISGSPLRWHRALLPVAAVSGASLWFVWRYPDAPMRTGLLSLICSLICAAVAIRAWRYSSHIQRPHGRIVASLFGLGALMLLARALLLFPMSDTDSSTTEMMLAAAVLIPALATVGFVLLCGDRLLLQLQLVASTDELTGLTTRRAFMQQGRQQLARARRSHISVAALLIDVDDFKQVNDRFGHAAGDQALRQIAHALADALRQVDLIGRIGGEEFAVLLVGVTEADAEATAERLRRAVASLRFAVDNVSIPLHVSIGMAPDSDSSQELNQLIERADLAMYRAKRAGRDRVAVAAQSEAAG